MVRHWALLFPLYSKVGISHFSGVKVSLFNIFFLCHPSCAHFAAPSCAVIILNGAPSSKPVYFLFKGWYSSFCCRDLFYLKYFFWCYPSCSLFSAPSCAVIILNGAPSSALVYFLFKVWYTSFCCRENFFLFKIAFVLPIVCTFFCPIVCSYYFEWCPIERTCLLFI